MVCKKIHSIKKFDSTKASLVKYIIVTNPLPSLCVCVYIYINMYVLICLIISYNSSRNMFRFIVLPSSTYLFTAGVEVVYFHLITLRHTPQSVELLWTRDRHDAETSTRQHKHTQQTNIHAPGGIRTHDPSKRSAADLCLRPAKSTLDVDSSRLFFVASSLNKCDFNQG
jgi:hypothetical protein